MKELTRNMQEEQGMNGQREVVVCVDSISIYLHFHVDSAFLVAVVYVTQHLV